MAVVGFWGPQNLDDTTDVSVFRCYRYFYIPNPVKRCVGVSSDGQLRYEVLFPAENGDVFFLFQMGEQTHVAIVITDL